MGESNSHISNVERALSWHPVCGLMDSKPEGKEGSKKTAALIQVGG